MKKRKEEKRDRFGYTESDYKKYRKLTTTKEAKKAFKELEEGVYELVKY